MTVVHAGSVTGLVADVVRFSWVDGPGNRYTVFLQGCNLNCLACHNPHTIPRLTRRARTMTVRELVDDVAGLAPFLTGVTTSGGEATQQPEFVAAFFATLGEEPATAGLTRYVDSNGMTDDATWDRLLPVTDGVMLDLKALDPQRHQRLTGSTNELVLASLDRLFAAGRLAQVRLLVAPGLGDTADELRRTGAYLAAHAPGVPVQLTGFRPHGVRSTARRIPEPTEAQRQAYAALVGESIPPDLLTVV